MLFTAGYKSMVSGHVCVLQRRNMSREDKPMLGGFESLFLGGETVTWY